MDVVDTHCHAGTSWFEPIETLLACMDNYDVRLALLTQHRGMFDNSYLFECIDRFPGRFSAIAGVDAASPDALATLDELAANPGVCGIRLLPQDRSPGDDPAAIWRRAGEVGLPISVFLVNTAHSADPGFQELILSVPDTTIILEHLCGMYHPRSPESVVAPYDNYKRALELASRPNTYIKFGGIGEFGQRPGRLTPELRFENVPPAMEWAYEAFGARRMMWGSDFPPVAGREGYRNSLAGTLDHPVFKTDEEREWAFGKTALEAFRVGEG
ncbi:MAG: amidohydrolase family protein [Chloroflexi bacterium]|nr:amidohydrolase family protein [Chloroflexota bacterium]